MVKRMFAVCVITLTMYGCVDTTEKTVSNGGGSIGVQSVTLEDGTKCAVAVGYMKGAISCNWK